ncbi:MAG: NADH:flavin oxidoreductase [Pseudomonadota bacterium]
MLAADVLFEPFALNSLKIPNRIVMAPMTRSFSPGNVPGDDVAAYYRARAEGNVGLILTEGVHPNTTTADGTANVPTIATPESRAAWKRVVDGVHEAGGLIGIQIWHEGPMRRPDKTAHPDIESWSPSGFNVPGKPRWTPMSENEIETAIAEFVDAAAAAKEAGFDCVEFHGAHSYLIDSFFWDKTNLRDDQWGGDWDGRTRMACEIIRRTRAKVGADYPLIIRISQWKQTDFDAKAAGDPDEFAKWLAPLVDAGIDAFHCSQRRFWEPEFEGSDLNCAGWAKKLTGLPSISVGSVGLSGEFTAAYSGEESQPASLDRLIKMMARDEFDLIAVGRALLQDPQWVNKIREGRHDDLMTFTKDALASLA